MIKKNFKVENLFKLQNISNMLSKNDCIDKGSYPVCSSDTTNNGIIGYCDNPEFIINDKTPVYITFGDHTRTFNIMQKSFSVIDNTKVLSPKINDIKALLYITTVWKKQIKDLGYARHWKIAKICDLSLPILVDEYNKPVIDSTKKYHNEGFIPNIKYMENQIKALEEKKIKELEKYLNISSSDDYVLNESEKYAVEQFNCRCFKTQKFKLGEGNNRLFDIKTTKKKFNANSIKFGGQYPYIARSSVNNGIRGYIAEDEKYLNDANTISFGQDTATMFYQEKPYFTGDKIKIMTYRERFLDKNLACYLITTMRRAFQNFSWGQTSFKETVLKNIEIELPILEKNKIDYDFIENFMNAQQKLLIKDVIHWRDKQINVTKQIVNNT